MRRRSPPWAKGQRPDQPAPRQVDRRALIAAIVLVGLLGFYGYRHWAVKPSPALSGVATVADGDSIEISGTRIRLEGIDALELDQACADAGGKEWPCGRVAARELRAHIRGQTLRCESKGSDQFQRVLAVCFLPDGSDLNAWMVAQGWALTWGHARRYQAEQEAAQHAKRGIWAGTFTHPREWRRRHPRDA